MKRLASTKPSSQLVKRARTSTYSGSRGLHVNPLTKAMHLVRTSFDVMNYLMDPLLTCDHRAGISYVMFKHAVRACDFIMKEFRGKFNDIQRINNNNKNQIIASSTEVLSRMCTISVARLNMNEITLDSAIMVSYIAADHYLMYTYLELHREFVETGKIPISWQLVALVFDELCCEYIEIAKDITQLKRMELDYYQDHVPTASLLHSV